MGHNGGYRERPVIAEIIDVNPTEIKGSLTEGLCRAHLHADQRAFSLFITERGIKRLCVTMDVETCFHKCYIIMLRSHCIKGVPWVAIKTEIPHRSLPPFNLMKMTFASL